MIGYVAFIPEISNICFAWFDDGTTEISEMLIFTQY
jgi:hypothetical protein